MNQELENLMRAAVARMGQLLEVIGVNLVFNSLVFSGSLFGVYLVTVVRTPQAYAFAPYVIGGSVAMAAKAGDLLHRKWGEYAKAEKTSEAQAGAWRNPSINVSAKSKISVLIANLLAVAAIALSVLGYSYWQIWSQSSTVPAALAQILPSLLIVILSAWAWLDVSK